MIVAMTGSPSTDDNATAVITVLHATARTELVRVTPPVPAREPGARLGRYLVIEELGRGGMGIVLRAYDPKLQREVALKVVRAHVLDDSAQARLVREARAMARLNHPNVVAVYDVELDPDEHADAGVVVVMEYVAGKTLRQWVEAEPRSWREIVGAFVAAGRGPAAAPPPGAAPPGLQPHNGPPRPPSRP